MILPVAFIEGIGGPELMMIMFIILLLFGANRLPDLAKGLGRSVREFKKAASGVEEEVRRVMEEHDEPESAKKLPAYAGTVPAASQAAAAPPPPPPPAPPSPPPAEGGPQG
ncbi:MAG TPA: twin-arginine translocase TatA/TatE family subunit [Lacunisphaera sp.]|jgi:sec-independent protein translocase protein TatA|nr:twin-arginine translocase TatA/TatE family subunit [Lacunisphaera sp.]